MTSSNAHVPLADPLAKPVLTDLASCGEAHSGHRFEVVYNFSDSDSDGEDPDTDSTFDDMEDLENSRFGHPLRRIPRLKSADHGLDYDSDAEVKLLLSNMTRLSSNSSLSQSVSSFRSDDTLDFDRLVLDLLNKKPDPFLDQDHRCLVMIEPGAFEFPLESESEEFSPSLMVRRLERSSQELFLLLELNLPELREDPWNPAVHILRAVEKDDQVYLFLQRLSEFNKPPLITVAHYIEFFRQVLEGLSFLHEQRIAGLTLADPFSYMVDLSSALQAFLSFSESGSEREFLVTGPTFDRLSYPVRYYIVNFTKAKRIPIESSFPSLSPATPSEGLQQSIASCPFRGDVRDCGSFFESLLHNVPPISSKFKSLTKAMIHGNFTADDARKLFEALCRSLDADAFDKLASNSGSLPNTPPH